MIELVPTALSSGRPGLLAGLVAALALLLPDITTSAHAEAAVKGTIGAVQVEARNSSVAEVLAALGAVFNLQYRTSTDLNRPVTGTFEGPVLKVISRLLKGYDYVVKSSAADQIAVTVIKFSRQDSGKVISAGASPYPPELFQPRPPLAPSPVQGSGKVVSTGASPYPPELFPAKPPLARVP